MKLDSLPEVMLAENNWTQGYSVRGTAYLLAKDGRVWKVLVDRKGKTPTPLILDGSKPEDYFQSLALSELTGRLEAFMDNPTGK